MDRKIIQIDENTYRIEDGFVRWFLLCGTEKAMVIDSGVQSPDAKAVVEGLTSLPVMLLNTHGDGDHTSGNAGFGRFYMHPDDYKNCRVPEGELLPLKDGDSFDLGGRMLRILHIPGHTYGSVAVLDETNRILYPGDTVQTDNIFLFGGHRCPEQFSDALQKLMDTDGFDKLYPSHGAPEVDRSHIQEVYNAWQDVCAGKISSVPVEMFGQNIKLFKTGACGFFLP